ncbi:MAG: methyltransferase domain-containing protein [Bacteroidales bacterium]
MESNLLQIREQQKEVWTRFSPGWKKWDELTMDFLKPMANSIIDLLKPKNSELVLDVASGTGEPGLTIATMLDGGKVIAVDLAEGMLDVARENANKRGIKNFETVACDVSNLPFPDSSFDAVSCRFGFMFFPDMLLAAKEMTRVLKPGGKIAVTVWNEPEKNSWATSVLNIVNENMKVAPPPQGAPGLFRCAKSGMMPELFKQAGLKNISEFEVGGKLHPGNRKIYWNFMTEVAAPVVAALNNADCEMRIKIRSEVFELIKQKYPDGALSIDSNALVIYGEK